MGLRTSLSQICRVYRFNGINYYGALVVYFVLSQDRLGLSPNIAEQIAPFMGELIQFSIILAFINHERQIQIA